MQRRILSILVGIAFVGVLAATGAWAGNAHYVGDVTVLCPDSSLSVSGKIAGLGNEPAICVYITGDAECINPGGGNPGAANKSGVAVNGQFPVQNGKANFGLTGTATFQPSCSPPMTVDFSNISVTVTESPTPTGGCPDTPDPDAIIDSLTLVDLSCPPE